MLYRCPAVKCRQFFVEELCRKWNVDRYTMCRKWNVDRYTMKNNVQNIKTIKKLATIVPGFIFYAFICFECLLMRKIFQ